MKVIDMHKVIDASVESDIHTKIGSDKFFNILDNLKIDLKKIVAKRKKSDFEPFHIFNFLLKDLHESKKVDIADACIYIEIQMLPAKDILACLNEENVYLLKFSLAERNNVKIKKNTLDNFMYR